MSDGRADKLPLADAGHAAAAETDVSPTMLRGTATVRGMSLALIATIASIAALRWGSALFIPLMISLVFSYALTPLVDLLERVHLPRALGAAVVLLAVLGGSGWLAYAHTDDANKLIDSLPLAAEKMRGVFNKPGGKPSPIETVDKAAEKIQEAAQAPPAARPARLPGGVMRVQIERPKFSIKNYLWTGTLGLMNFLGQTAAVFVLTFFLLAAGRVFRLKMVRLAGPRLSERKIRVEALDEISAQIQRYLLVQVALSILTGVVTWGAFAALGLENAPAWGALAGVLNMIPYLGFLTVTAAAMLVAFLQFGNVQLPLAVGGVSLLIHTIIGQFLTPWLTGRASQMNAVAVFVGVLAWGWLWGVWGLLLAVPIMVIAKVVCDRVEELKPIGEFLGE